MKATHYDATAGLQTDGTITIQALSQWAVDSPGFINLSVSDASRLMRELRETIREAYGLNEVEHEGAPFPDIRYSEGSEASAPGVLMLMDDTPSCNHNSSTCPECNPDGGS